MKFHITCFGRLIGSIGGTSKITQTIEAPTAEEARKRMYESFEHLTLVKCSPVEAEDAEKN